MEIKILVPENRKDEFEKFIQTCEGQGFSIERQGGGKMPNFSGYYASLKGTTWKCEHPYFFLSEDSKGLYCTRCKEQLKPI